LISYQYESSAIGSSAAAVALSTRTAYQTVERRIRAGANIRFDIKQRVHLTDRVVVSIAKPLSLETRLSPDSFSQIIGSDSARERVFASIEYAQLPATSDCSVRVFVNLPTADSRTPSEDPHYAGSFAFFGTEAPDAAAAAGQHRHQPRFLVNLTEAIHKLRRAQELGPSTPVSLQLVPTPFAGKFEREDTELALNAIDIITTPVVVSSASR